MLFSSWQTLDHPEDRDQFLAEQLAGLYVGEPKRGPLPGGRTAALDRLREYDPSRYGKTRNYMDAPVSQLSPYLRHGMISTIEVRDQLRERFGQSPVLEEFLRQLAWRDFFEKVLDYHGTALDADLEPAKHGVQRSQRTPLDMVRGDTGLPCIDGMLSRLFDTGYLHNHERLWFAAYWCHYRGLSWQPGAKLFRQHLYDGDIASNSSSWQWVESTFAHKPYFMNKENIAHYSGERWCADCTASCPFDHSYDKLQVKLFGGNRAPLADRGGEAEQPTDNDVSTDRHSPPVKGYNSIVWLHDAALSPEDVALRADAEAALVFVFDQPALQAEPWAFHRLRFVFDGLWDLARLLPERDIFIAVGEPVIELQAFARSVNASRISFTDHPNHWVRRTGEQLRRNPSLEVRSLPRSELARYEEEPKRFTRYWNKVARQVLGYQPKPRHKHHR